MKKLCFIIICLGILVGSQSLKSQPIYDFPYVVDQYDFISYKDNVLSFPGDSSKMDKFFDKMDKLMFHGKGKINIVHFGGSHVQADIVSGRLRQRLATFYPGNKGSRGLIFPFKVAKTNNPYNYFVTYTGKWTACKNVSYKATCELGVTGMSITTQDTTASISISLKKENYPAYDFNRIRLFHRADSNQYNVKLGYLDPDQYEVKYDYEKGITDIYLKKYQNDLTIQFKKVRNGQWFYTLYGIQLENDDPGITYHSIGVNGAGTYSYLKCTLFEEHLKEVKPDLVIFGIGINDAAGSKFDGSVFQLNYQKLLDKVEHANPGAAVILITNNDSYRRRRRRYYVNYNATVVKERMYMVAKENNQTVWDFFTVMGGIGSMATWQKNKLGKKDRIHFTSAGYIVMGDLMFNAILRSYEHHMDRKYK